MTVRFFMLQAHYRSTVDFSNEALQAAEKGLQKLLKAVETIEKLKPTPGAKVSTVELKEKCYEALDDDLNSPVLLSHLFDGVRLINSAAEGLSTIDEQGIAELRDLYRTFVFEILGLRNEAESGGEQLTGDLMDIIISLRKDARDRKDYSTSDKIRNELGRIGIILKDKKDGVEWEKK
jgi:cysteinyl-tRNA synthetase